MRSIFTFLLATFLLTACHKNQPDTPVPALPIDTTQPSSNIPDTTAPVSNEPDTIKTLIMGFGSSTIARWDLEYSFPNKIMKKAGYKGLFIDDLVSLTDTIKIVNPVQVLLYAGSNDVISGQSAAEVTKALQDLMLKIWKEAEPVHITYITINASDTVFKVNSKSDDKPGIETLEEVNANMIDWIGDHHAHHASVIDSYTSFLAFNPKRIDPKYYEPDKLHLNQSHGYPRLNELTAPKLK